jgi:hypothetical protein
MVDQKPTNGGQDQDGREHLGVDEAARAFAAKFSISPDMAKRLLEQHRAILERETRKPRR